MKDLNLRKAKCKDYYPTCLEFDIETPIAKQRWSTQRVQNDENCIKCGKHYDVFHACCQYPETLSFLQEVFDYIDPKNQIKEQLTLEGFIFGIDEVVIQSLIFNYQKLHSPI